jgi:hypothetical protein
MLENKKIEQLRQPEEDILRILIRIILPALYATNEVSYISVFM